MYLGMYMHMHMCMYMCSLSESRASPESRTPRWGGQAGANGRAGGWAGKQAVCGMMYIP